MLRHQLRRIPWAGRGLVLIAFIGALCARTWAQEAGPPSDLGEESTGEQISEYVRQVFQDRDGNLWLGTNGDGVCRWDWRTLTYLNVNEGLAGSAIRGIVQDRSGAMWFATEGGVSRWQSDAFRNYTVADGLSDNDVWSLMLDSHGRIWAGTHEGVCRLEGESFVAFPLPRVSVEKPESRFTPKVVFAMIEDRAGNLWFGTDGEGVHRTDGKTFTSFTTKEGLAGNMVRALCEDRLGRVWIGTDGGGASCYDGATFRNFTKDDGLNNNRVFEIIEDRAGSMWFSTLGAGACRYDGTTFRAFGATQGLTKSHVQSMLEDSDGTLWFGCSGGLFRLEGERFINVMRDGPWKVLAHRTDETFPAPMKHVARLVGGEWKMVTNNQVGLIARWGWGPGRYSVRGMIDGVGGDGKPWRALQVLYWDASREQMRSLAVSQYREGVAESVVTGEDEQVELITDMYQWTDHRKLKSRWTFQGADRYHDELMESTGPDGYFPLASWDWERVALPAVPRVYDVDGVSRPSEKLKVFAPLLDHVWKATVDGREVRTRFQWIPLSNVVCVRIESVTEKGEREALLDAYVFYHSGHSKLWCVALADGGVVREGEVTMGEDGAVDVELKGQDAAQSVRLDFALDGTVRGRVWSQDGDERALVLDVKHERVEARGDSVP